MPELPPTPAEEHADMPANGQPVTDLLQRAEEAERQRDEYFSLLKQAQADFENAYQRNRRDREQERQYMAGPLAKDLLPALDNLERAMNAATESKDAGPLAQGVALVRNQILDALKRHGITPIEAEGMVFDPNLHQAVMQMPAADKPANTVVQVLEKGFLIHDRILRPASVIVSTSPAK
jgi:molecular chaperone GrpE